MNRDEANAAHSAGSAHCYPRSYKDQIDHLCIYLYSAFYNQIVSSCSTESETQKLNPQVRLTGRNHPAEIGGLHEMNIISTFHTTGVMPGYDPLTPAPELDIV